MTGLTLELNDFIYCKLLAHQSYGETVQYYNFSSVQFKDTACKCYTCVKIKSSYRSKLVDLTNLPWASKVLQ